MGASSQDIRNDWVEEINAAIEMGKERNFGTFPEDDLPKVDVELPGNVEPVFYPDYLADCCQVNYDCIHQSFISFLRRKCALLSSPLYFVAITVVVAELCFAGF